MPFYQNEKQMQQQLPRIYVLTTMANISLCSQEFTKDAANLMTSHEHCISLQMPIFLEHISYQFQRANSKIKISSIPTLQENIISRVYPS